MDKMMVVQYALNRMEKFVLLEPRYVGDMLVGEKKVDECFASSIEEATSKFNKDWDVSEGTVMSEADWFLDIQENYLCQ